MRPEKRSGGMGIPTPLDLPSPDIPVYRATGWNRRYSIVGAMTEIDLLLPTAVATELTIARSIAPRLV